jgi:hypothetical protein
MVFSIINSFTTFKMFKQFKSSTERMSRSIGTSGCSAKIRRVTFRPSVSRRTFAVLGREQMLPGIFRHDYCYSITQHIPLLFTTRGVNVAD